MKKLSIIAVTTLLSLLCGCSLVNIASTHQSTKAEVAVVVEKQQRDIIAFNDALGNEISLGEPARKVVGTHGPTLNTAVALCGGGELLAGYGGKEKVDELFKLVVDGYEDIPQVGKGKDVNFESVLASGADVAIMPERYSESLDKFKEIGITPIVVLPNEENFDVIKNSLNIMGSAFGLEHRADAINSFISTKIEIAQNAVKDAKVKPSVLFLGGSQMLSVAPDAMIQTDIINYAGGINAVKDLDAKGKFAKVSVEEIIKYNPDIIWIPSYASYTLQDVLTDPALKDIPAIKNSKVYTFPSALEPWDYPTAAAVLGVCWAANNLHPELYTSQMLQDTIAQYYTLVYSKTFTADQLGLSISG